MERNNFTSKGNEIFYKETRVTLITDRLVRFEHSPKKEFVNEKTQMVVNRDFPEVEFEAVLNDDYLEINTPSLFIQIKGEAFNANTLSVTLKKAESEYYNIWRYGDKFENLGGTARTLDEANGEIPLEDGIFSRRGYAVIDDSNSMLQVDDFIKPREKGNKDLYFFGYGHDFISGLKALYSLTGKTPMLPRYALGNWWSRYYKYTTKSYLELMDRFEKENVPFSVAVIDMDWHLVDIDPKYGSGWTGYTWNKEFFPDPKDFLDTLHKKGLKVTLNDHPADGVRAFENNYKNLADKMGVDSSKEEPVLFEASDKKFLDNLQMCILEPLENEGVDFWWIDWQQGSVSKIEGLDPLWILNHHRFNANKKNNKRPMIFSRYAGVGSHRYPVGFSGDSHITWESLAFQPKFTACASNVGYGWWSHDIGGHMKGYKDSELAARWVQYGVFSPIMRLHSSSGEFNGKEPWRFGDEIHSMMNDFLRLRHKLLPYTYTMSYKNWAEGLPLIRPMYYHNPKCNEAYEVPTQYYFGSEMIVSPVVSKNIASLKMGKAKVWLPEGNYYDFFTSRRYKGNRKLNMFRTINDMPVLIKEGNVIVLTDEKDAEKSPKQLEIKAYCGANGSFTLYEDDGISENYLENKNVKTLIENNWNNKELIINKGEGDLSLIPSQRDYKVSFVGIEDNNVEIYLEGEIIKGKTSYDNESKILTVKISNIPTNAQLKIVLNKDTSLANRDLAKDFFELLDRCEIEIPLKEEIYSILNKNDIANIITNLSLLNLDKNLFDCILEILLA